MKIRPAVVQIVSIFFISSASRVSVPSAVSDMRHSTASFDNGMSFMLFAADWPNTSLQAEIKEGL
jgi:hypothetical protein